MVYEKTVKKPYKPPPPIESPPPPPEKQAQDRLPPGKAGLG